MHVLYVLNREVFLRFSLRMEPEKRVFHYHSRSRDRPAEQQSSLSTPLHSTTISCTQILRFQPHFPSDMDMGERAKTTWMNDAIISGARERASAFARSLEVAAAAAAAYYIAQFRASSPSLGSSLFAVQGK